MRAAILTIAFVMALPAMADETAAVAVADTSLTALGKPATAATLDQQRGGDDTEILNTIHVNGDVTDNTATNVITGANNIQDGSFDNASGVLSVVQNTGANVLIQSATIVNVQFAAP